MGCLLNTGYTPDSCEERVGGVEVVMLNNFNASDVITIDSDGINVSVIEDSETDELDFYVFEQELEAAISNGTVIRSDNGSIYIEYVLTIRFENLSEEMALSYNQILKGRLRAAVKGNNGKTILLGTKHPARISGGDLGFGQAFDDLAGGTVELTFREPKLAPFLDIGDINLIYMGDDEGGD